MDSFYFIIVLALILLAISDLIVGVSNDAVNFLNSAFGSLVAKKKTILIVAAVGILVGALSSSGMMEIARKGIFNPEMFSFADIMTIFLAVMITDILLLDLFNTYGMPTSTTVSIMFELLGAAFIVACIKIMRTEGSFSDLGLYLNGSNALLIISGIFLSVLIAFTIGFFVQYISRLIFTFNLKHSIKRVGPIFGGLAITTITYFLLIKGLKGSAFMPESLGEFVAANSILVIVSMFAFWTLISFALTAIFKLNILKIVVLFGTFSLAMAFAGNDLVNFIGVPLAGLQAYNVFQASGTDASDLGMGVLGDQLQTSSWILLAAGLIMIAALWFSKKAQSVTETEINLASQNDSNEKFKPNLLARFAVRGGIATNKFSTKFLSEKSRNTLNTKFKQVIPPAPEADEKPAFDLVRASVNLMTASVLIAFATSLKLPLSTTYVSFMVAMGTSLADRAWSRDSAVYRVAGVINVIVGWLMTAAIAFTGAAILALTIYFGGMVAIIGLLILTTLLMIKSQFYHKKIDKKQKSGLSELAKKSNISSEELLDESNYRISITLFKVGCVLRDVVDGMQSNDKQKIHKAKIELNTYQADYAKLKTYFNHYIQNGESEKGYASRLYLHSLNYLNLISQSVDLISKDVFSHLHNLHNPFEPQKANSLKNLTHSLCDYLIEISDRILANDGKGLIEIQRAKAGLISTINDMEINHVVKLKVDKISPKSSLLFMSVLVEYRNILRNTTELLGILDQTSEKNPPKTPTRTKILN